MVLSACSHDHLKCRLVDDPSYVLPRETRVRGSRGRTQRLQVSRTWRRGPRIRNGVHAHGEQLIKTILRRFRPQTTRSRRGLCLRPFRLSYLPRVNPTLTLAALSLRLSRHPLPRLDVEMTALDVGAVHVVNHSGEKFRVWLSNYARISTQDAGEKGFELKPGQKAQWRRKNGVREATLVYRCDQTECWKYVKFPELFVAQPGKVLAVV